MTTIALVAAASLAAAQAASLPDATEPTPSIAEARLEVCYTLAVGAAFPMKIADCLKLAHGADFESGVCGFLSETAQLEDFGFRSPADCIRRGLTR